MFAQNVKCLLISYDGDHNQTLTAEKLIVFSGYFSDYPALPIAISKTTLIPCSSIDWSTKMQTGIKSKAKRSAMKKALFCWIYLQYGYQIL